MEPNFNYGLLGLICFGIWILMTLFEFFINIETDKDTNMDNMDN